MLKSKRVNKLKSKGKSILLKIQLIVFILAIIALYLAVNDQADDVVALIMPKEDIQDTIKQDLIDPTINMAEETLDVAQKFELKKQLFDFAKRKEVSLDSDFAVTVPIARQFNQSPTSSITKPDGSKYYIYGEVSYYIPDQCDRFFNIKGDRKQNSYAMLFGRFSNDVVRADTSIFDDVLGFTPNHMQNLDYADDHEAAFSKVESKVIRGYSKHLDFNTDLTKQVIKIYNQTVLEKACYIDESNLRLNVYVGARGGLPGGIVNQKRL